MVLSILDVRLPPVVTGLLDAGATGKLSIPNCWAEDTLHTCPIALLTLDLATQEWASESVSLGLHIDFMVKLEYLCTCVMHHRLTWSVQACVSTCTKASRQVLRSSTTYLLPGRLARHPLSSRADCLSVLSLSVCLFFSYVRRF